VRAGEALKLLLLRQRTAVPLATSAPVFLIEKVCEAVALATLALAASPFLPWGGGFQAERRLGLISGALLALGAGIMFRHQVVKLVPRLPLAGTLLKRPRVGRLWSDLVEGGDRLLTWPTLFAALGVSLLARLCDGVVICLVGAVFGIELSLAAGWFMIGSSGFLGGISMVPGGAGVADATLIGLFMAFGGGPATAIAAALVSRLLILWLWVALGLGLALHCAVGPRSAANEAGA
jgi:uncharacterized membrane protein YbhN (UPF0104 family)